MIATCGAVPVRIVTGNDLHSLAEIAADTWDVVRMMCNEVARGVHRNVKEMGASRIGDMDVGIAEEAVDLDLCGVEVGVTTWVADRGWVPNAFLDEVFIKTGGEWVNIDGEVSACVFGLLPFL